MSSITSATGATLSALFKTKDDATDAVDRLVAAGIPQASVRLVPGNESDSSANREEVHRGFFDSLANFFMPEEDRYSYAEGLQRGSYLVTVSDLPTGLYDQALDILDDEGAVNLDEQEQSWRQEGWTGYEGSQYAGGSSSAATMGSTLTGGAVATNAQTSGSQVQTQALDADQEEVIPVIEEELRVGKRDVNLGRVRVRSYVREQPVSEQVNLRQETVSIERRAVDRPVSSADAVFQDRTIEAEEHAEEAVVQKSARVVEEVALRKDSTSRQETVSDTVKRTEVEVEDERGNIDRLGGTAKR